MFPNALCREYDLKRPDVVAVAIYDVNNNYWGRGIGTYLVTLLKMK
jgi:hypothetical protein